MRHRRVLLGLSMDVFVALGWGAAERYKDPTVRWRELRYQVGGYEAVRLEQRRRLAERHGWAALMEEQARRRRLSTFCQEQRPAVVEGWS
jgi:hypothetical protein